jgi:hypothetical protein
MARTRATSGATLPQSASTRVSLGQHWPTLGAVIVEAREDSRVHRVSDGNGALLVVGLPQVPPR